MDAYGPDLAHVHDTGFGAFARESAPALLALLERRVGPGDLVVDLGCGSGLWAEALVRAGYEVLGIDLSSAMLALARARVPAATFRRGSLFDAALPPCRAVTALGECVNYGFDRANDRAALRRLFRRVHDALEPGGLLAFDFAEPGRGAGAVPRLFEGPDWEMLVDTHEDRRRRRLERRIVTYRRAGRRAGRLYRRSEERHELRLWPASELARDLRALGFRVRLVRGWGARRFPARHAGIVATRPR